MRATLGLLCYAGGITSLLFVFYYYFLFLGSVKPDKKKYLPFLGPAMFFIPQLTGREGNHAVLKLLFSISLFALFAGGVFLVDMFFPRQN